MTAQIPDQIRLAGRDLPLHSTPLDQYFYLMGIEPGFQPPSSALWRGYVATWEVVDDRLYLVELESYLPGLTGLFDVRTGSLEDLFPGSDRVFAHWYHGELCIPQGPEVDYMHGGFGMTHELALYLAVRAGVITGRRVEQRSPGDI